MAEEKKRRGWLYAIAGLASTAIAVLAFPAQVENVYKWFAGKYQSWDAVDLPATYPGELWKVAKAEQFAWLEDEWCYPTIPGFRSRFRVVGDTLERQNIGQLPKPFTTEWWKTKVYLSNKGVLRIWYDDADLPGNYISFVPDKTAEWHEYERYARDDGSTRSGRERLVLSCKRCSLSSDGISYSCK